MPSSSTTFKISEETWRTWSALAPQSEHSSVSLRNRVGMKVANVTDLARRGCSLRRLEAEVSQCEVRCANCHRRRTLDLSEQSTGSGVRNHDGEPP